MLFYHHSTIKRGVFVGVMPARVEESPHTPISKLSSPSSSLSYLFPYHWLSLLPAVLLHHQDLNHADEDIEEVKFERNALVNRVFLDDASLGQAGVV